MQSALTDSQDKERLVNERFDHNRKRLRVVSRFASALVAVILLAVAANSGMVYVVVEAMKNVHTTIRVGATSSNGGTASLGGGVALVSRDGTLIETSTAQDRPPLYVAPVLPTKQLSTLKVVSVTLFDFPLGLRVTRMMHVTGVTLVNSTFVVLDCGSDSLVGKRTDPRVGSIAQRPASPSAPRALQSDTCPLSRVVSRGTGRPHLKLYPGEQLTATVETRTKTIVTGGSCDDEATPLPLLPSAPLPPPNSDSPSIACYGCLLRHNSASAPPTSPARLSPRRRATRPHSRLPLAPPWTGPVSARPLGG